MQAVPFDTVFQVNPDGSLATRANIRVGGITVAAGTALYPGQTIANIDFTRYIGRQLQVEIENDIYVIKAIYA